MNVIIEIEELVLHGFPAGDRHAIADALADELSRLVAERPLPLDAVRSVDGIREKVLLGQFVLPRTARGQAVGVAAGRAVLQAVEGVLAGDHLPPGEQIQAEAK